MNTNLILGLLDLLLENVAFANVGDVPGLQPSATAGNFYISLHNADPGATGNQATHEVAYTGYARQALGRASGNFTVSGTTFSPAATISFPPCTGGTDTAAFAGMGNASAGAGLLFWSGPITPVLNISTGLTPELTTATTWTMT